MKICHKSSLCLYHLGCDTFKYSWHDGSVLDEMLSNRRDGFFFGHLFYSLHLRDIKLQHVLDAVLQRDDGTGAAGTRALELQLNDAVLKTSIEHVATVLLHRGPGRRTSESTLL